jgi:hypothetical protein
VLLWRRVGTATSTSCQHALLSLVVDQVKNESGAAYRTSCISSLCVGLSQSRKYLEYAQTQAQSRGQIAITREVQTVSLVTNL